MACCGRAAMNGAVFAGMALVQSPDWPTVCGLLEQHHSSIGGRDLFDLAAIEIEPTSPGTRELLEAFSGEWSIS